LPTSQNPKQCEKINIQIKLTSN